MPLKLKNNEDLTLKKQPNKNKAVLGTLEGPCADIINPTRNGRKYSDELWGKTFNSDIVKELFAAGGIFGELGHPADRTETDPEKIAICMPKPPRKNKDGLLMGEWDILDTPCGRILKTLVDYGYKIGISSRGSGDVYEDMDGNECVDADTYDFQGFDAVILPAVKAARLTPVTEGLSKKKTLQQALTESLNAATPDERKIMEEKIKELNLVEEDEKGIKHEDAENTMAGSEPSIKKEDEVVDDKLNSDLIENLQEALKQKSELESTIINLQNNIAVSNTKADELKEEINKQKIVMSKVLKSSKEKESIIRGLREDVQKQERVIREQQSRIKKLVERLNIKNEEVEQVNSLNESIKSKTQEVESLKEDLNQLNTSKNNLQEENKQLKQRLEDLIQTHKLNLENSESRLNKALKESKKKDNIIQDIVEKYIEFRAKALGIRKSEIKSRLDESFTLEDIDAACEEIQDINLNISNLPFDISRKDVKGLKATKSSGDFLNSKRREEIDGDDVDESLIRLANIER